MSDQAVLEATVARDVARAIAVELEQENAHLLQKLAEAEDRAALWYTAAHDLGVA